MTEYTQKASRGWGLLRTVLIIESVGALWLTWSALTGLLLRSDDPLGQRISLFLVVLASLVWVLATCAAALRRRAWARASNITLQILVLAAAVGVLQGILGTPLLGAFMLIVSVVGIIASLLIRPAEHEVVRDED